METGAEMKRFWTWWTVRAERTMDARPLALLRILVPLMVFFDLLRLVQLDLVTVLFRPYEAGGLSTFSDPSAFIHHWNPLWAGPLAVALTMVCMLCISLGRWMRPAIVLGCFAYAQLGHIYPPGDRAIDRILRCALLALLFVRVDQKWAWNKKPVLNQLPAWPADLIKWMLVMIYMSAGISKMLQQPRWMAVDGMPVLFRIMMDPLASNHAAESWVWAYPLFRLAGWVTIFLECSAFLLMTRWCHWWAIGGGLMHLGIGVFMTLGMFSWGMLSVYPILLAPFLIKALDRKKSDSPLAAGVP
jgi:hypothetical protein